MVAKSKVLKRKWSRSISAGDSDSDSPENVDIHINGTRGRIGGISEYGDVVDMAVQRPQSETGKRDRDFVKSAAHCTRYRDVPFNEEGKISTDNQSTVDGSGDNYKQTEKPPDILSETTFIVGKESQVIIDKDKGSSKSKPKQFVESAARAQRIDYRNGKRVVNSDYYTTLDPFGILDCLGCLFAIGGFLADVGSDIFVAILYFNLGRWVWFGLTIGFIVVPAIVTSCFSLAWYIQDIEYYKHRGIHISYRKWFLRILFHILQIGPVLRYIDIMRYGVKSRLSKETESRDRKHYIEIMLNEDADTALLRLLECFMEAAPQLTLQLYILCSGGIGKETLIIKIGQGFSCVTSLASLSWALTSYHRCLRLSLLDKAKMSYTGMALQFIWRFLTVGCRVLAFALFASTFKVFVFIVAACHWFAMFIWVLLMKTSFCDVQIKCARCQEVFFNMVIAAVYVYCFVNVSEGHTRLRYIIYYCIVYVENFGMCLFWYMFAHTHNHWYLEPAMALILGGFFIGIMVQVIYYLFFHPNNYPPYKKDRRIKLCLNCEEFLGNDTQQQQVNKNTTEVTSNLLTDRLQAHGLSPLV